MNDITTGAGIGVFLAPLVKVAVDAIRHWFHIDGRWVHVLTVAVSIVVAGAVVYGAPNISIQDVLQVASMIASSTLTATGVNEVTPNIEVIKRK
mgnify:CR=1 FL=1